jgi:hypothetical protein
MDTSFRAAVTKGLGGGSRRAAPGLDRDRGKGVFAASPGGLAPPTAMVMTAGLAR